MVLEERKAVKSIVSEVLALSPTGQVYLARLWARGVLGMRFLSRGKFFRGKKFRGKYRGVKRNVKLVIRLGDEFLRVAYIDRNIEDWMESRFLVNIGLPPRKVAEECCRYKGFRREMLPWLAYLSRKVKKRLLMRMRRGGYG